MTRTLTILRRELYGNITYYPVCDASHALAEIAGTKTLTRQVLAKVARLGYTVQITQPEQLQPQDLFTSTQVRVFPRVF